MLSLWTNSVLVSARRIYEAKGFRFVHTEVHNSFGPDLTAETWELDLWPCEPLDSARREMVGRHPPRPSRTNCVGEGGAMHLPE